MRLLSRTRLVHRSIVVFVAAATCAVLTAAFPAAASANALYCINGSSLWNECIYHYITSKVPSQHVQGQSDDTSYGPIYGHTELIAEANGSSCPQGHANSSNGELFAGQHQTVTINIDGDSCHIRWCAIFWESRSGGSFVNFFEECANIPT